MQVYYERTEVEDELDREMVAAETDIDILKTWFKALKDTSFDLHTQIASVKLVNPDAALGMARKLGYIHIAMSWVTRRIADLGEETPEDAMSKKYRTLKHHLTCANQQLEKKNKQLKELRAKLAELKAVPCDSDASLAENGAAG
ncbi:hypothetical protein [Qipengyuania atrilutea]|uniref:PH domain-containing protein n=1 Tax=Qipengyuania atrilutea TaxID=2744473 RepID=A0A850H7E8_9SPHN|nr:hypothetical protein [Actirhodobacter atriluteus]NVD45723.1 hypothetical protein [Actirhodobacter atriluteus]